MVVAYNRHGFRQKGHRRENVAAHDRVTSHDLPFLIAQGGGFVEDALGYGDLADIVERCRDAQRLQFVIGQSQPCAHPHAYAGDAVGVTVGVGIFCFKDEYERLYGHKIGFL